MLFLHADDLFAQRFVHQAERVRCRRIGHAVVNCVDGEESVVGGEVVVEARGAKVFANPLQRMGKCFGNAISELRPVLDRPQTKKRRDARSYADILQNSVHRDKAGARKVIGHQRYVAEPETLAETLVIAEEKYFVRLERASESAAEDGALKGRSGSGVKIISCIEHGISQKLVDCAVELVGAGCGNNADLRAGPFAVFGAKRIRYHIEFANGVDAKQLAASAPRGDISLRRTGVLDAIQQEEIFLGAMP